MSPIWRKASCAPRRPSSASASRRAREERTSAYSAMTKNELTSTSSAVRTMSSALTPPSAWGPRAPPAIWRPGALPAARRPRAPSSSCAPCGPPPVWCYFGMGRRRSFSDAGTVAAASRASDERVDLARQREVGLGDPARRVRAQHEPHPVVAVHGYVGVVARLLGRLGHPVHQRDRLPEVAQLQLPDERVALATPFAAGQSLLDRLVCQPLRHLAAILSSSPHAKNNSMRIVSLVPSATEMLFALGLGADVVAVTHECDYPPAARELPKITSDVLPAGLSPAEIDAAVRERTLRGPSIYALDDELLRELEPDLIVTQALCSVCAVSADDVRAIAEELDSHPRVISLDPRTLGEVLGDVRTLAQATGAKDAAVDLIRDASARIDRVRLAVRGARRLRVAALEWLDPPFAAGHWTPQLIEHAGGEDVLGFPGEPSEERSWEEVAAAQPDVVVVMPCGFDAEIAHREAEMHRDELAAVGAGEVVAVDAGAYFSRPGPRIVDGLELLAHILHPELVPEAPGRALTVDL